MPKPFANSPSYNGDISENFLLGIQTGTHTGDSGLPEMMNVSVKKLRAFMKEGMGSVYNYRGAYSTLPTDLAVGDTFYCSSTFTTGGVTYTQGHLYAWNGSSWDDITDIFTQYAQQSQVDDIETRLSDAETKIDAMEEGIVVKGECTYAELLAIVDPEAGWEYWVTDKNAFYLYSETDGWIKIDNGIVQTITDGDTTHAPSADAVYDAFSDVKNALTAVDHRVQNLESAKGDYVAVDSDKGVITTPSGKGKWAVVEKLRGVSRAENQKILNYNFSDGTAYYTLEANVSLTASGGIGTVTSTVAYYGIYMNNSNAIAGHTYLISIDAKTNVAGANIRWYFGGSGNAYQFSNISSTMTRYQQVVTPTSVSGACNICMSEAGSFDITNINCKDLTLYFGSTVPTLAEIQTYYPWLLEPSDYGTSLVDTTVEGVKSVGVNICDNILEDGSFDENGQEISYPNWKRTENYFPIAPSTAYYYKDEGEAIYATLCFYDSSKNFISRLEGPSGGIATSGSSFTTPSTASYLRVAISVAYGSRGTIQVCLDSLTDKTTIHPYMTDTLSLPTTITLRSAGSGVNEVHDTLDVETGVPTIRVKEIDISTLQFGYYTGTWAGSYFGAVITDAIFDGASVVASATCSQYMAIARSQMGNYTDMVFCFDTNGQTLLQIKNASKGSGDLDGSGHASWLEGVKLTYKIAESTGTSIGASNPTILTESGGTISAQTEEPIDGNFSVGFITL